MTDFANLVRVPPVLKGEAGEKFIGALTTMANTVADGARQAVRATWINDKANGGPGPAYDALDQAASELTLPRYPREEWAAHEQRLSEAWETYQTAGTEQNLIAQFEAAGFPGATIETAADRPTVPGPYGVLPYWSQFWVVFQHGEAYGTVPGTYGSGHTYGDGLIYGIQGLTAETVALWRKLVKTWKPGRWICRAVILVFGPRYGDAGLVFGAPGLTYGGTQVQVST